MILYPWTGILPDDRWPLCCIDLKRIDFASPQWGMLMRASTIALAACFICRTLLAGGDKGAATQPSTAPTTAAAQKDRPATEPATRPDAVAAGNDHSTTAPTTRPADLAVVALDKAMQEAASKRDESVALAAKQYKADLQKVLGAAMKAGNLNKSMRYQAEIDRVTNGGKIDDVPEEPSEGDMFAARRRYDLAVKKADEVQARE